MNIEQFQKELKTNFDVIQTKEGGRYDLEFLYNMYLIADRNNFVEPDEDEPQLESYSDELGGFQDQLIDFTARHDAKTMKDILFKIALWRRHADQIDPFDPHMTCDERLSYSIFKDVVFICNRQDVFTARDKAYILSR